MTILHLKGISQQSSLITVTCECYDGFLPPGLPQKVLAETRVVSKVRPRHRVDGEPVALADRHHRAPLTVAQLHGSFVPVDLKKERKYGFKNVYWVERRHFLMHRFTLLSPSKPLKVKKRTLLSFPSHLHENCLKKRFF